MIKHTLCFLLCSILRFAISNEIFYCNFDQSTSLTNQCGGSGGQIGVGTITPGIITSEIITIGSLITQITDIRSITGPTVNNSYCNIPFYKNNNDRYFCYNSGVNIFRCEVGEKGSNIYEECIKGNMLRIRTNGGAYAYSFLFSNPIKVDEPGDYIISFYTFFNCHIEGCENVDDTLSIKIKRSNNEFEEIFQTGSKQGRYNDITWKKEQILLYLNTSEIYVIKKNPKYNESSRVKKSQ